jgi:hypothetical protein
MSDTEFKKVPTDPKERTLKLEQVQEIGNLKRNF